MHFYVEKYYCDVFNNCLKQLNLFTFNEAGDSREKTQTKTNYYNLMTLDHTHIVGCGEE